VSWTWLRALHLVGIHNALAELLSTTILGASVYVGLTLWRKLQVLIDLANTLLGLPNPLVVRFGSYVSRLAGISAPTTAPD